MNTDKIKTLLLGMASINKMLTEETKGDEYFEAVVDRFMTDLIMAGTGLSALLRSEMDTDEFEPLIIENMAETKEFPPIVVYGADGKVAS